jgi:zinc transport system permease protein
MGESSLAQFFEAWELFRHAALSGAISGALLGFLGVYVVLRRLVFLTAAISQAAGLGVAAAFYAQIAFAVSPLIASPTIGASLLTLIAILPFALERGWGRGRRDSMLGFGFLVGAAGTLALGTRIVEEVHDIDAILFGSAVAVLPEHFAGVAILAAVLFALHLWWVRGFIAVSFDPAGSRVRGLPVRLLELILFATLALAVSASTRVLGALPTFAFSVLPAMASVRLVPNVFGGLIFAAVLGSAAGFMGYVMAYLYELPVGASQTLVAASFVAVAELLARARYRLTAKR